MGLRAGTSDDAEFTGSMAEAMEDAFAEEWLKVMGHVLPHTGRQHRRMMFAAIAQGVVKHLRDHAEEAFDIRVRVDQESRDDDTNLILSKNGERIQMTHDTSSGYYWGFVEEGDAKVKQYSPSVVSVGKGTVKEIRVEGALYGVSETDEAQSIL